MKILERRAASYDAGIQKYAAGDFSKVREKMLSLVQDGDRVLDVGCGPGTFAVECAKKGAIVDAVDVNPQMLYTAQLGAAKAGVENRVTFRDMSATELDYGKGAFDVIVFSLSLSELRDVEQWVAMNSAFDLLKPDGKLIVADEVVPAGIVAKTWYHARRLLLLAITYIVTRATTRPVCGMEEKFRACGFDIVQSESYEHGSLKLLVGRRMARKPVPLVLSPNRLCEWTEVLGEIFSYLTLVFQAVPIRPGLYRFGNPSKDSPVLVTANYLLTFSSVKKHLRGVDCYLLVIDTRGINVWCAAGEGNFSAEEIHTSLLATRVGDIVDTRTLVLPKLSSNGVRYREVKRLSGWKAVFGPVYARNIPEYLRNGCVTTDSMKRVSFDLAQRLRVAPPFALFVAFLFCVPLIIFHDLYSPLIPLIALAAGLLFPAAFYLLPTEQFFKKALALGLVGTAAAAVLQLFKGASFVEIVRWGLIITGITLFVAMDFSGMSAVSNYSRIKREFYVAIPILGLIVLSYIVISVLGA
jgi:ubiquinone/menaquinone biosynthesis C-methylase UbiE